jgi:zinc transport system ATP-binding protein
LKDPAILLSDVSFSYGSAPVLQRVNLQVEPGEFLGIMGPNGGGKTTLLKLIMGFLLPSSGKVRLFGDLPTRKRLKIGYVPQIHRTDRDFPISVLELVLLGSLPGREKDKAEALLHELGLCHFRDKPFSSLSGGLAQKALLARALLSDPELLILDEPTANIDTPSRAAILERLENLKRKKTILIVTHDLKTIVERIDRILCVQTSVDSLKPSEVCEHFAMGLYHTPLLDLPNNHFTKAPYASPLH